MLACSGFLLFIGLGVFALGMAIQNEAIAEQHTPCPKPIYYCATGAELPAFEPCKEMRGQRDTPIAAKLRKFRNPHGIGTSTVRSNCWQRVSMRLF